MSNTANIINGIAEELSKFPCVSFLDDVQLSDGLLDGSIQSAAVIACSEMGWLVPYVCSSPEVQLHLFQNFGNAFTADGFVETIVRSEVRTLVIYGHSPCEYMKFCAKSAIHQRPEGLLDSPERHRQLQLYAAALGADSETLWERAGQFNVLCQLKEMLADPIIGPMAAEGTVKLHGWFFSSANSQLEVFDPEAKAFMAPRIKIPDSLSVKPQLQDD